VNVVYTVNKFQFDCTCFQGEKSAKSGGKDKLTKHYIQQATNRKYMSWLTKQTKPCFGTHFTTSKTEAKVT